jgi:hypothetical protein
MPTTNSGVWGGLADGMPSSPDGGNFAACGDWSIGGESFSQVLSGFQIGKKYEISFYYANAGIEGATSLGGAGRVALDVHINLDGTNAEVFTTPFIPYLGEGTQQWFYYKNTFVATANSHLIQFSADNGIAGEPAGAISNPRYVALDGVKIRLDVTSLSCDFDNDGIPNYLDLDSDNDGCSDALEAGATTDTTKNFKFAGPYGINGLANSKETVADNGVINYQLTYNEAINASLNGCLDTDGDGVLDKVDIDDDNDGILDTDECKRENPICFDGSFGNTHSLGITSFGCLSTTLASPDILLPSQFVVVPASPDGGAYYSAVFQPGSWNETSSFPLSNLTAGATYKIKFYQISVGQNPNWTDGGQWVFRNGSTILASSPPMPGSQVAGGRTWKYEEVTFVAPSSSFTMSISPLTSSPSSSIGCRLGLDGISMELVSSLECDTDGDGIPNRLDLDSDNDGCSDALEAGATADTTKNFKFSGPFGTNGLANSKETVADNGIINYTSTYNNALTASIKGCIDTDGDGIFDIYDIDDDNDGILDKDESNCPSHASSCLDFDPSFAGVNLVVNGGFSSGNTGFTSSYIHRPGGASLNCSDYHISPTGFVAGAGSCSGTNAMQINADCSSNQVAFWCQEINVTPFTNYKFGFSMRHLSVANIAFSVDNGPLSTPVPTTANWTSREFTINSGNKTKINICLYETSKIFAGADFGIDDIYLVNENAAICSSDIDTDGDGIQNLLDLQMVLSLRLRLCS